MATTFTGFSNLPKELQLQIWVYAIPGPRLVYLNFEKDIRIQLSKFFYECDRAPRRNIAAIYTHASCAPPALLHICSTSREVALKHYSLAFAAPHSEYGPIYFDFSRDTLLLDHDMPWHMVSTTLEWHSFLNAEESNRVQFLALTTDLVTTHALTQWDSKLVCAVETFPKLQNITVVKRGPGLVYPALTWRDMTAGNFESWWYATRRFSRFFSGPVVSRYTSTKTMTEFFRRRFRGWKAPLIRHVEDIKALKKINCA